MPILTSGMEKNAPSVAIATSQHAAIAAPPPMAPPATAAMVGLGRQAVEARQHVQQGGAERGRGTVVVAIGEVGAGAKMPAAAAKDDKSRAIIGREAPERCRKFGQHGAIEGVAAIRPVQQNRRYPARRDFHCHRL
jgi:hypothetical protein